MDRPEQTVWWRLDEQEFIATVTAAQPTYQMSPEEFLVACEEAADEDTLIELIGSYRL